MRVENVHERKIAAASERVGALIDTLASAEDGLWPRRSWPRMRFDRPLGVGAAGGHGPIGYFVEEYTPGRSIRFRFTGPKGFDGWHGYEVVPAGPDSAVIRQTLEMAARGRARLTWPLLYRPLHDALIEDSFTLAESSLGQTPRVRRWSLWVRFLRFVVSGGKAKPQHEPGDLAPE